MKPLLRALFFLTLFAFSHSAIAQPLHVIAPKQLGAVKFARLSPDGKWTLISGEGGLSLWENATARRVAQLSMINSPIEWSPDGRTFAVSAGDKVQIWSLDTLQRLRSIAPSDPKASEKWRDTVQTMAFDATGKTLAIGSYDRSARLWDVASGKLLRVFRGDSFGKKGHSDQITSLAFAKNGQWLITASWDGDARVWDIATGKTMRVWNHDHYAGDKNISTPTIECLAVARDGETVAAGGGGFNRENGTQVFLWNAATGRTLQKLHVNNHDGAVNSVAFSRDGKAILAGIDTYSAYDDPLILWDVASGKRLKTFVGHVKMLGAVTSVQWSRDGKSFLSGSEDRTVRLWNLASGQNTRTFSGSSLDNSRAELSFDGNLVASGLENGEVRVSDASSGRLLKTLEGLDRQIYGVKFSPDAHYIAASAGLNVVVWDTQSGRKIGQASSDFNRRLLWNADSSQVLAVNSDTYDVFTLSPTGLARGGGHYIKSLQDAALSPDGRRVYAANLHTKITVLDNQTDKPILTWTLPAPSKEIALAPDESVLAVLGEDGVISVWNAKTGAAVTTLATKAIDQIAFDQNNAQTLVARGANGQIRFFNALSGAPAPDASKSAITPFLAGARLLSDALYSASLSLKSIKPGAGSVHYLALQDGDWLAYTDDGRFDGSPGGIAKVSFARGLQTYSLEQFSEQFYRPGLIQQVLGGTSGAPTSSAQTTLAQGAPPTVRIVSPLGGAASKEQIEISVEATEQNCGGIKAIRLYQNGRLVGGPSALRGIVVEAPAQTANTKTQRFNVVLAPGDNVLRAVAYSQTDLESAPAEVKLSFAAATQKPALRVLVVGINDYIDSTMNLAYARPDAEALAQFFESAGQSKRLFSDVSVKRLVDGDATGAGIKAALTEIGAQAKPEDVVFVYLAGHGETAAAEGTRDDDADAPQTFYFLPQDARQMIIKQRVRQYGLSGPDISALIAKIPARKIVLIYDSCKSGAAITGASRGAGDEQQALAQLARAQGIYVLAAATGQQYAGEVKSLGHGILTYALLEGLSGKAAGADSIVKVSQLFAYTEERVPELAKQYRGREQWPVPFERGQNFPLVLPK